MCGNSGTHWARTYFNRTVGLHMKVGTHTISTISNLVSWQGLQLHDIRHVSIAVTQNVVNAFAITQNQQVTTRTRGHIQAHTNSHVLQMKNVLVEAAARLSGHSAEARFQIVHLWHIA